MDRERELWGFPEGSPQDSYVVHMCTETTHVGERTPRKQQVGSYLELIHDPKYFALSSGRSLQGHETSAVHLEGVTPRLRAALDSP